VVDVGEQPPAVSWASLAARPRPYRGGTLV